MPLIMSGQTTTGPGSATPHGAAKGSTFQAAVAGTGAVTATVAIEVSNDPVNLGWITLGTINLSGTNTATDGFAVLAPWAYARANVTERSGTNAAVSVGVNGGI